VSSNLVAALVGGGLALAGLLFERLLRSFGRLWCEPWGWMLTPTARRGRAKAWTTVPIEEAERIGYSGLLDLFNGKEIPVGLRDVRVVFSCDDGVVVSKPEDALESWNRELEADSYRIPPIAWGLLHVVNLPPRQWVLKELEGRIDAPEECRLLMGWRSIELVAERQKRGLFESKVFRRTIATRSTERDPVG
jgi:hypothetical protein